MDEFFDETAIKSEKSAEAWIHDFLQSVRARVPQLMEAYQSLSLLFRNHPFSSMLPLVPSRMERKSVGGWKGMTTDPTIAINLLWNATVDLLGAEVTLNSIPDPVRTSLFESKLELSHPLVAKHFLMDYERANAAVRSFLHWYDMPREEEGSLQDLIAKANPQEVNARLAREAVAVLFFGYLYFITRAVALYGPKTELITYWTEFTLQERQGSIDTLTKLLPTFSVGDYFTKKVDIHVFFPMHEPARDRGIEEEPDAAVQQQPPREARQRKVRPLPSAPPLPADVEAALQFKIECITNEGYTLIRDLSVQRKALMIYRPNTDFKRDVEKWKRMAKRYYADAVTASKDADTQRLLMDLKSIYETFLDQSIL